MSNNLTPEVIYRDNFKAVVLDHLYLAKVWVPEHGTNAYKAVRDMLAHEHYLSTSPETCPEAYNLLWSAPAGWKLVPEEIGQLSDTVPIECIMQEDQSMEYSWIYESNLRRAGL